MACCETEIMFNHLDSYLSNCHRFARQTGLTNPRRRWRQAVTNVSASQKFLRTLDLKLKAEKDVQEIHAAHLFIKEAQHPAIQTSYCDFGIGQHLHNSIPSIPSNFLSVEEHVGANGVSITDEASTDEGLTVSFNWAKWLSQGARPKLVAPDIMVTLRVVLLTLVVLRSLVMIGADPTCVSGYVPGGNGATGGLVGGTSTSGQRAADGEDGVAASSKAGGSCGTGAVGGGNGGGGSEDTGCGSSSYNTAGSGSSGGTAGGGVVSGAGTGSGGAAVTSGFGSSSCNTFGVVSSCGAAAGTGRTSGDMNGRSAGFASSTGGSSNRGAATRASDNGTSVGGHVVCSGAGTGNGGAAAVTNCGGGAGGSGCGSSSGGGVSSCITGAGSGGTFGDVNGRSAGCTSAIHAGGPYTTISIGGSHPTPVETSHEALEWMLWLLGMGGAGGIGGMQVVDKQKIVSLKILFVGINVSFGVTFLSAFLGIIAMAIQRFRPPTSQLNSSQLKNILKISSMVSPMFMVVAIVMVICFNITRQF